MADTRIDRENGIIRDVSLIALGDARGHKKAVDNKTLESVVKCAKEYGELRVKWNPDTFNHGDGSLAGYIPANSLRVKDGKALGDIHLYDNFNPASKEYLYEIAEKTPKNIGVSIEFSGEDEVVNKQHFARCDEIFTATIVDLPAANPTGLFSIGPTEEMSGKEPYGDVEYADPGYQSDKKKRYPLDTDEHIHSAWSYINVEKNAGKYSSGDLTKVKNKIKAAMKRIGAETKEDMSMTDEQVTALTSSITASLTAGFNEIKQLFAKKKEEDCPTKEEMSAAGVTDEDDEATKKKKVDEYRANKAGVTTMSVGQLRKTVQDTARETFMQCFRQTGGKPAKISPIGGEVDGNKDFEALVADDMAAGGIDKGKATMRMRKKFPKEYNAFMAGKHPGVQHMVAK